MCVYCKNNILSILSYILMQFHEYKINGKIKIFLKIKLLFLWHFFLLICTYALTKEKLTKKTQPKERKIT